jgi:peptidoglycan hydrolase CwlO-like protein
VRKIRDGLKGSPANRSLDDKIKQCHRSIQSLEEQVNYLHLSSSAAAHLTIGDMAPRVANTENIAMRTRGLAQSIEHDTRQISDRVVGIETGVEGLRADLVSQKEMTYRMNKQLESNHQATKNLSDLLRGVVEYAEC